MVSFRSASTPSHADSLLPDLTDRNRVERIEQLLRRAVERGGYMTNADLIEARELLRRQFGRTLDTQILAHTIIQ